MAVEGVNSMQMASVQQAPQPKVAEVNVATNVKPMAEPIKVNTEDTDFINNGNNNSNNKDISNEQIKKTVASMNKKMQNTACQYGIHEGTGRVTIKIVDKETKDVIKEFPAEETLELIAKAWELAGIMVDEKL